LGYNAIYSVEIHPTFREEHVATIFRFKAGSACCFMLGVLFEPENVCDMFLRNVGWLHGSEKEDFLFSQI
jgi:hypothetical protein